MCDSVKTAGRLIGKVAASSFTGIGRSASRSMIAVRIGSASAARAMKWFAMTYG